MRIPWIAIGVALLTTTASFADEFHYENLRYGQRALGMAGAVIADPTEPEATYYNPAGLGFLRGSFFSGSLHFFGIDERDLVDGFQLPGFDPATVTSDGFVALPSSSVITYSFGGGQHIVAFTTCCKAQRTPPSTKPRAASSRRAEPNTTSPSRSLITAATP